MSRKKFYNLAEQQSVEEKKALVRGILNGFLGPCNCDKGELCELTPKNAWDWKPINMRMLASQDAARDAVTFRERAYRAYAAGALTEQFYKDNPQEEWFHSLAAMNCHQVILHFHLKNLMEEKPPAPADKYMDYLLKQCLASFEIATVGAGFAEFLKSLKERL